MIYTVTVMCIIIIITVFELDIIETAFCHEEDSCDENIGADEPPINDLQFNVDNAVSSLPADLLKLPENTIQATPQDNPATENSTVNELYQILLFLFVMEGGGRVAV